MKKLVSLLLSTALLLSLAACGNAASTSQPADSEPAVSEPADSEPADANSDELGNLDDYTEPVGDEKLNDILNAIYEACPLEMMLVTMPLDLGGEDWMAPFHTGLEADQLGLLDAALESIPMIDSQAYSLLLTRVADPSQLEEVGQLLFDNAPLARWICVAPDAVRVVGAGDILCVLLTDNDLADADAIVAAFSDIVGGQELLLSKDVDAEDIIASSGNTGLGGIAIG